MAQGMTYDVEQGPLARSVKDLTLSRQHEHQGVNLLEPQVRTPCWSQQVYMLVSQ